MFYINKYRFIKHIKSNISRGVPVTTIRMQHLRWYNNWSRDNKPVRMKINTEKPSVLLIETDVVMQYVNSRTLEDAFNLVQVNSMREAEEIVNRFYFNAIITDQAENNFYKDHEQKLAHLLSHSLNKAPVLICQALLLRQKDIDILLKFGYKSFFYKPLQTSNITEGLKKDQPTHL